MMIEIKKLSSEHLLLFLPAPLPIYGTFYHHNLQTDNSEMLSAIATTDEKVELLLTKDFLYIHASKPEKLEDLEALALAELSEYDATAVTTAPLSYTEEKAKIILAAIVAPFLQKDGGDIELVACQNNYLSVRFLGHCQGCPYAQRTLKERVEKNIVLYLPNIKEVTLV